MSLAPGHLVRVRALFPPGHVRTPHYLRGHVGRIVEELGDFPDPEAQAYGRAGTPWPLYRVRFVQADLWPDYAGADTDTLVADLAAPWLEALQEPATP